jgi:hypothetical protein
MSEKAIFVLRSKPHPVRQRACEAIMQALDGYIVTLQPPKRSLAANAKMWCLLSDVSKQVIHHGQKLKPESWKDLFTAHLKRQVMLPNIEGDGWIALGTRTSEMSVGEMNELIECIYAYGSEHEVKWSEPHD